MDYLYRQGLSKKVTSKYAHFKGENDDRNYIDDIDGKLRLTIIDDDISEIRIGDNFIYDVGGILVYRPIGKTNLQKYENYQCESCYEFTTEAYRVGSDTIFCGNCNTDPKNKDRKPLGKKPMKLLKMPTLASPLKFSDSIPRLDSAHIYFMPFEDEEYVNKLISHNQTFSTFGIPNKPILIIPNTKSARPKSLDPPSHSQTANLLFDNYEYADEPKFLHYHFKRPNFNARFKNFMSELETCPKESENCNPTLTYPTPILKSAAWAMIRYIVIHLIRDNWHPIMMYKIYDVYGFPHMVPVDHRISTKMLQSAVCTTDENNINRSTWYYEVFLIYKAICKVRYGGDCELTLEDVMLGLSGRQLGTVKGENTFHYSKLENTLYLERVTPEQGYTNLLELQQPLTSIPNHPDLTKFSFDYVKVAGKYEQVGDYVYQKTTRVAYQNYFELKTGFRSGIHMLYIFHGIDGIGRITGRPGDKGESRVLADVNLNGGCLVFDDNTTLPTHIRVYVRSDTTKEKTLAVTISYWKLKKSVFIETKKNIKSV